MDNKALMGACAVVLVAILAGTYLWMDVDDDDTITWHATHYECLLPNGYYDAFDADVDEEWFPLTIDQRDGWMFIGTDTEIPIIGIFTSGTITYEYQLEYQGKVYNVYANGIVYDTYMNVVIIATDFDTGEPFSTVFVQYTLDGKPAASMESSYFDFDMPFIPVDSVLYKDSTATSIPVSPLTFKSQEGMFATFDLEVKGITDEIVLIGAGYTNDGIYSALGYGCIYGDYTYFGVNIADGVARFLFDSTSASGEAYYVSSTYEVPYQAGQHWAPEDIEGTWTGELYSLNADGSTGYHLTSKVIEKVDDNYYTCTEETTDNGTFTWDMFVDGDFIDVRVFRTIDGTTEEIGFLSGNSYEGFMYLEGIQYRSGYVDGYAVTFYMYLDA